MELYGIRVAFLDIEASALEDGSFPIEIGWAPGRAGEFESFLIRPTAEWAAAGVWSDLSEEIHGISKADLHADGVTTAEAIARLERALFGSIVLSDALEWDAYWLRRSFEAANRPCPIELQPFDRTVKAIAIANGNDPDITSQRIEEWALLASETAVHRAGPDAADNYRRAVAIISAGPGDSFDLEASEMRKRTAARKQTPAEDVQREGRDERLE